MYKNFTAGIKSAAKNFVATLIPWLLVYLILV